MNKKFTFFSIILFLAFFAGAKNARALDMTAAGVSESDVQTAINQCNSDATCRIVNVPAGTATWADNVEIPNLNHDISIIGAGMSNTILTLSSAGGFTLGSNSQHYFIRISGFRFNFINSISTTAIAIKHTASTGFRVDHCYFYGKATTNGMIGLKYVWRGLVDNCIFEDNNPGVNLPYGVSLGGPSVGFPTGSYETCTDYSNPVCISDWDTQFWDNSIAHDGQDFNENYIPGTADAVFIENCKFINMRSAIMWNWGSKSTFVSRYNQFLFTVSAIANTTSGSNAKPGTVWLDSYNNEFSCTLATPCALVGVVRCSATIHNNSYKNITRPGYIEVYSGFSGYMYTPQTQMDEVYVWGNTYDATTKYRGDCFVRSNGDLSCGWYLDTVTYNKEGVDYSAGYFNRLPAIASGDRFDYVTYTCPHPLTGLTGVCDTNVTGQAGYNIVVGFDTTPPAAPTGVAVQ